MCIASHFPQASIFKRARRYLVEIYTDLDPGGLKISLTVKVALSIFLCYSLTLLMVRTLTHVEAPPLPHLPEWLSALAGQWRTVFETARQGEGLEASLPLLAAIQGANLFMMFPEDRYRVELGWFFKTAAVMILGFTLVGLAAPGSWGMGDLPAAILWVLLITLGIFLRAFGPEMRKPGTAAGGDRAHLRSVQPDPCRGPVVPPCRRDRRSGGVCLALSDDPPVAGLGL